MSEKKPTLLEVLDTNLKVSRQDTRNPHKQREDIAFVNAPTDKDPDEDENTLAKSLIDDIIEETESGD